MSLGRDQICAGVTRYLRRYLQISSQISADNRRTQIARSRSCSLRSSHSLQLRCCLLPPPSRRHLAPSSSRPPPVGHHRRIRGGRGGVVVVVVIRIRAPHVVKEMPGVVVLRMGEDDRPSATTARHVLPLWRRRCDAICRGRRRDRRNGGATAGLGIF